MKIQIETEIGEFPVPDSVISKTLETEMGIKDGVDFRKFKQSLHIPLKDLSPEVLDELCSKFRREVFKKAGKSAPAVAAPVCSICAEVI